MIIVNLDVMMAKRKISLNELSEKVGITLANLSILKNNKKLDVPNQNLILWHLPKSMSNYTKILLKEFFMAIKLEIMDCYKESNLSDFDLENILDSAPEVDYEEYY